MHSPLGENPLFIRLSNYTIEKQALEDQEQRKTISGSGEFRLKDLTERLIPDVQSKLQGGALSEESSGW